MIKMIKKINKLKERKIELEKEISNYRRYLLFCTDISIPYDEKEYYNNLKKHYLKNLNIVEKKYFLNEKKINILLKKINYGK